MQANLRIGSQLIGLTAAVVSVENESRSVIEVFQQYDALARLAVGRDRSDRHSRGVG